MNPEKYNSDDKFDKMLAESLRRHSMQVQPNFTAKVINKIEQEEQQQLLARIVMQEKVALGSSITLAAAFVLGVAFFGKDILATLLSSWNSVTDTTNKALTSYSIDWEMTIVVVVTTVFILYGLLDGLNLKKYITSFKY
jgi:hypothetical protein